MRTIHDFLTHGLDIFEAGCGLDLESRHGLQPYFCWAEAPKAGPEYGRAVDRTFKGHPWRWGGVVGSSALHPELLGLPL